MVSSIYYTTNNQAKEQEIMGGMAGGEIKVRNGGNIQTQIMVSSNLMVSCGWHSAALAGRLMRWDCQM